MDILNPTNEDINFLATTFALSPLTVGDIRNQVSLEKVESLGQYYVVCFRLLLDQPNTSKTSTTQGYIYAIVFPGGLLSLQAGQGAPL